MGCSGSCGGYSCGGCSSCRGRSACGGRACGWVGLLVALVVLLIVDCLGVCLGCCARFQTQSCARICVDVVRVFFCLFVVFCFHGVLLLVLVPSFVGVH